MTATQVRASIIEILDSTPDVNIIHEYHQILLSLVRLQKMVTVAYDADGEALTEERLKDEVAAASARVKSGQFIRHVEAKMQANNW